MAKSVTIYGIKHCDTMKKARAWGRSTASPIHSMTTKPRDRAPPARAVQEIRLGNFAQPRRHDVRKLPDKDKTGLNAKKAIELILAQPSML